MVVSLLKVELLSEAHTIDTSEFYSGQLLTLHPSLTIYGTSSSTDDTYCCLERDKLQNVCILNITTLDVANVAQDYASYT